MITRNRPFCTYDTIHEDMVQYKKHQVIILSVSNIEIDMKSEEEKETILAVFQQIINSFNASVQLIQRRKPLDVSKEIMSIDATLHPHEKVKEYAKEYKNFYKKLTEGKLEMESYLVMMTDRHYKPAEARQIFSGILNQLKRAFKSIGIIINQIKGLELKNMLQLPEFIKEELDYLVLGNKYIRTYIVTNYPRTGYPNWLKPILSFPHPIEVTQHLHPFSRERIIHALEISVSKMTSTVNIIQQSGAIAPMEIMVKINDAEDLIKRLASGKDRVIETSFYVTIEADNIEELDTISYEVETVFRHIEIVARRARKQMNKALRSIMPICNDELIEDAYMFDSASLSTLIPYTARNYSNGGILYGMCSDGDELITIDKYSMPNPNKIILGLSGYGKSMLAKIVDISREIVTGTQVIAIDHNYEYETICTILGGQYIREGDIPDWNKHFIVFGRNKVSDLRKVWEHIYNSPIRKRGLIIDEIHNILTEDKELVLLILREIRKYYTAPTLITQNVLEFLRSDSGRMIMDLCSIKILMRQGDNDLEEVSRLFDLSKQERSFLKTCEKGSGYIFTSSFKTKFQLTYSDEEEEILSTDPNRRKLE